MTTHDANAQARAALRPLNTVVENCPPSGIRRFFDIAQRMQGVISLGVGEPDFVTPDGIRGAGIAALQAGRTSYTGNAGLPELRQAVCEYHAGRYGVDYDWDTECCITVGVSEAVDLALRVLLNPGDEVIVPEPCYVSYVPGIEFAGGRAVTVATQPDDGFLIHADDVAAAVTPRTKAILIGSPANPTGAVQSRETLQAIVDVATRHGLYIVSDEIYERLVYGDATHTCIAALPGARDRTVMLNGFSKAYAMTGWRVGYACAPAHIASLMTRVHQYTMLCAPHMSQIAATEAIRNGEPDVQRMVAEYDRRRRFIVGALNDLGLHCREPQGAFYAFPSIRSTGLTSEQFAEQLLEQAHVAVAPGSAFGVAGEGFARVSYATSYANLEEAVTRIGTFLAGLPSFHARSESAA